MAHRFGDILDGGGERLRPGKGIALGLGQGRNLFPHEPRSSKAQVDLIAVDLPAAADDAAGRQVEPRRAAADLDLLAVGQPPAILPQRVVEDDADVLELGIEIGARGKREREADEIGAGRVEVERADDAGCAEVLGAHPQLDDPNLAAGQRDAQRVAEGVVVQDAGAAAERVGDVPHFVALTEPDGGAEVVLDDAQVVAVVIDVGGQLGAVAPAHDALLAGARGLPVHFQLELIRFDEARRLAQAFAELPEKEQEPVGLGFVVLQRTIRRGAAAARDGARHQRERRVGIPGLSGGSDGCDESQHDERRRQAHRPVISRGVRVAASALVLLAGCSNDGTGIQPGVPISSLLALPRVDSTFPPRSPVTLLVHNNVLGQFTISHPDAMSTVFATFAFPAHSIVAVGDTLVCDTCTVRVTVTLTPGQYGFTLRPAALVFNLAGEPTVSVSYGTYGDLSVYTQSSRYATASAYEQALVLYRENTPDHWVPARNSSHSGAFALASALETPTTYLIAAAR